jgi:hyperosmotically inducible protein
MVTGKVKTAITTDNGMKDADISVKTENGIVTLTGTAKSPDQVTLAAALAQRQEGVSRVENQVTVK